jgi:hypothetical protein
MKKQKVLTPEQEEQLEFKKNLRRLNNGWELHCWRMSSPHNYWLTGKQSNSEHHLDRKAGFKLVQYVEGKQFRKYESEETVPYYSLRPSRKPAFDSYQAQETIWRRY